VSRGTKSNKKRPPDIFAERTSANVIPPLFAFTSQ
jgi:hypothetical protein